MEPVFKILREIESNSSRNTKKAILEQNKSNELLKRFLLYTYNERWVYGVGSKSIRKYNENKPPEIKTPDVKQNILFGAPAKQLHKFMDIFALLDDLIKHPFGSGADVKAVNDFLESCNEEEYYWYAKLILKDLKIGCTAKTINEVFEGLIPEFEVMLAHLYKKYIDKVLGKKFQIQKKLDGYRLIVYLHPNGSCQFFTRNGLELFEFPQIENDFKYIQRMPVTMVYDGELIANDKFNDTQKLVLRDGPKTGLVFNVFDVTTMDEWENGESFDTLFPRYDLLQNLVTNAINLAHSKGEDITHIELVNELYRGDDLTQATIWFNTAKELGWEGIMLKVDAPYVRKRSQDMLKFKQFDTLDLRVIRVNEGTGKNEGTLGSVTVDYKGNEVNVGSGFSDAYRSLIWQDPNRVIDKIIEVQYFEETVNERGQPSLRFPVFKRVREDK